MGVFIRNYKGKPLAALSEKVSWIADVDCLEARTALRAIQFALELGIHVHLEGDSATVISAVSSFEFQFAPFGCITQEVVSIINTCRSFLCFLCGSRGE